VSNTVNKDIWTEDKLVDGLKRGQEAAFRQLVRQYQGRLFGIAYGMTHDREESLDIVQEVFLKVYRNIQRFRQKSRLSTWLHRITVNQCLNWKRRWKSRFKWHHRPLENESSGDYPELGSDENLPEKLVESKEFSGVFQAELKKLPADARMVFVLKEIEGLSYDEIAAVMRIKKGTVSSRLFYVRRKLRAVLSQYINRR
jgi:RNA polymerase sigma-70 factor (ECF subfamily)